MIRHILILSCAICALSLVSARQAQGGGMTREEILAHLKHMRATDISSEMIEIARRKAAAAGIGNIDFEQAAFEDVVVPAESLDMVLGLSILHLLDDKDAALARVYGMLKPRGVFVSSTACLADSQNWFRLIASIGRRLGLIPRPRPLVPGAARRERPWPCRTQRTGAPSSDRSLENGKPGDGPNLEPGHHPEGKRNVGPRRVTAW